MYKGAGPSNYGPIGIKMIQTKALTRIHASETK